MGPFPQTFSSELSQRNSGVARSGTPHGPTVPQSEQWGSEAVYPQSSPRLTKKELRLICSLINSGDNHFIDVLMAHVRADDVVARTVFKGICHAPEMLSATAGETLLELLRHQRQPKYAAKVAVAYLETLKFATSFGMMEKCAQVLADQANTLDGALHRRIVQRALLYPTLYEGKRPYSREEQLQPWMVGGAGTLDKVDYAGAISVLLLAAMPRNGIHSQRLLKKAIDFAKSHPEAENLWLSPLRVHAPRALQTWQIYAAGQIPTIDFAGSTVRAMMAATFSCFIFSLAKLAFQQPAQAQPNAQLALVTLALGSTAWGLKALLNLIENTVRLVERHEVEESQAEQVLKTPVTCKGTSSG